MNSRNAAEKSVSKRGGIMKKTAKKILMVCAIVFLSVLLFSPTLFQGGKDTDQKVQTGAAPSGTPDVEAEEEKPAVREEGLAFFDHEPSLEKAEGPLEIYEIVASNTGTGARPDGEFTDWIEIKNISSGTVDLSDYFLSDKNKNRLKWQLPAMQLKSGELLMIYCDGAEDMEDGCVHASFSISASGERIWLSDQERKVVDYANVSSIPIGGSYGRMDGEDGWFYFGEPTPHEANRDGLRQVCEKPTATVASGQYDNVESLTIELDAPFGEIYYTTDGDAPGSDAILYTEPIVITETTIIQAVAAEEGTHTSRIATFSYFVNEGHTMPILAFNAESYNEFDALYHNPNKIGQQECVGSLALYENGEEVFNQRGGMKLKGFSSIVECQKKSLGVYFRGRYGDGELSGIDLFDNGVTEYSSLVMRSGQDQDYAGMRNELMQELCLQFTDKVPTQHNQYAALYVNGHYMGVYALKENMNEQYYASLKNVDSDSVSVFHRISDLAKPEDEIYEAISFCMDNDMSDPEMYAQFSEMFDIENVIDFLVIYCYGGNTDTLNNIKIVRSSEEDNKWRFCFYDQDKALIDSSWSVHNVFAYLGQCHSQLSKMANNLCENAEFRDRFLTRYAEAVNTVLSDENVLRQIEVLYEQLEPEMSRDRARWGSSREYWEGSVDLLRSLIENGHAENTVDALCQDLKLTAEERSRYFG